MSRSKEIVEGRQGVLSVTGEEGRGTTSATH